MSRSGFNYRWIVPCRTMFVAVLVALVVAVAGGLGGCGSGSPASSGSASSSATGAPVAGGTLTVGIQPTTTFDPYFTSTTGDILVDHQLYNWLVNLDAQNQPVPELATAWKMSADGKTWTFTIREGVKFTNGTPLTAADVVYSFNRMRDPKLGAATASVYAGIGSITAPDATHVVFTLKTPNPEFVKDCADYHAGILSKSVKDPSKEWIGTGPFMIKQYTAEDRVILVRNPNYWGKDESGTQLPYLDGITFLLQKDTASMVSGLSGGQIDFVPDLTVELAQQVKADTNLKVLTSPSNFHFLVHLRCDKGHPAADPRVRLALRMGTDYQGLIDLVRPGYAELGNGTIVGPVYGSYYWNNTPKYDPEGAKKLLAEAGYAQGYTINLYVMQYIDANALATVWKEQMKKIGVTVNINSIPEAIYYADSGNASWLKCDFGVTNWAQRSTPAAYFNVAYITGSAWNESHWSDPEFDGVVKAINSELDATKRADLYHKAQQILWERGPVVTLIHENAVAGAISKLNGVTLPGDMNSTRFETAYLAAK